MKYKYVICRNKNLRNGAHIFRTTSEDFRYTSDFERFCVKQLKFKPPGNVNQKDYLTSVRNVIRQFRKVYPHESLVEWQEYV